MHISVDVCISLLPYLTSISIRLSFSGVLPSGLFPACPSLNHRRCPVHNPSSAVTCGLISPLDWLVNPSSRLSAQGAILPLCIWAHRPRPTQRKVFMVSTPPPAVHKKWDWVPIWVSVERPGSLPLPLHHLKEDRKSVV